MSYWFILILFYAAGAFAAFFTTAYSKKDETEFLIAGIKGRPLPEVPKAFSPLQLVTNGNFQRESDYAEIPARRKQPENFDISPYAVLPRSHVRNSDVISDDSAPSSPIRTVRHNSFKGQRSRSSTQDSREYDVDDPLFIVPHDSTGMFCREFLCALETRIK